MEKSCKKSSYAPATGMLLRMLVNMQPQFSCVSVLHLKRNLAETATMETELGAKCCEGMGE